MPSIDVAMERSVRRGAFDVLVNGLQPALENRSVVSDVQTAFSSWDNCMQATYCKYVHPPNTLKAPRRQVVLTTCFRWPVIAVIIVGGLIVFSIVWCIARCLCCGLSCCCECCACLKCCGNCCGCCDKPRSKAKYLDDPYIPPNQGYRSEAPMTASAIPPAPLRAVEPPQYAVFDDSKKGHEDALPEMPTWGESRGDKIAIEDDDAMELKDMRNPEKSGLEVPLMTGVSPSGTGTPGAVSPITQNGRNPYGAPGSQGAPSGYFGAGGAQGANPYGTQGQQAYSQVANGYGQSQTSFATDQGYGMQGQYNQRGFTQSPALGQGGFAGAQSPQQGFNEYGQNNGPMASGITQPYGAVAAAARRGPPLGAAGVVGTAGFPDRSRGSPAPQQGYGQNNTSMASDMNQPYGMPAGQGQPLAGPGAMAAAVYADRSRGSPVPQQEYGQNGSMNQQFGMSAGQRQPPMGPGAMAAAQYGDRSRGSPAPSVMGAAAYPDRSRGSPAPGQRGNYADRSPMPPPQRQYSADASGRMPRAPNRQYSQGSTPQPQRSYTPQPQRSYTPQQQPQRSYTSNSARQPPRRQYSNDVASGPKSPGPENNGGFDFQSGYSRPEQYINNNSQQQPQQSGAAAYPGYKPYKPSGGAQQQNGWNGQR